MSSHNNKTKLISFLNSPNRKNYTQIGKTDCKVSGFLYANHVIKESQRAEEVNFLQRLNVFITKDVQY